jgi:hypothetical protein
MVVPMTDVYSKAVALLKRASETYGFKASEENIDNYGRVWTRDSVVCGLAALSTDDDSLKASFRNSLNTLFQHQHPLGFIPSNVQMGNRSVASYGGPVGRADAPAWAVLGLCAYSLCCDDTPFAKERENQVALALTTLDYWEFNGKNLVYVPRSGDWADEYDMHGYLLSTQLLRLKALELAARLFGRDEWNHKAQMIRQTVQDHFHVLSMSSKPMEPTLTRQMNELPDDYWFAGFNPGEVYPRFDLLSNALALWTKIGTNVQNQRLFRFLETRLTDYLAILPAFYPEIKHGDAEMNILQNNYSYRFRNKAGAFHNGGLWPVWHGFMAAACRPLRASLSERLSARMRLLPDSPYAFNECYHAHTLEANGIPSCSWSAAGSILSIKGLPC